MKLRALALTLVLTAAAHAQHQPEGVREALDQLATQPATRLSFALDRDTLQAFLGNGDLPPAAVTGVNFERYSYREPAFYVPEEMHALVDAYNRAGWSHLVDANVGPAQSATPSKPIADIWLHHHGADFDHITVLIRGAKQMNLIEVSGMLRPLDLVHLSGHFGIPKVDPNAVMVPAPPGK
jgi:hypothetical protein